jgi:Protein of unknown function (DUF1588)
MPMPRACANFSSKVSDNMTRKIRFEILSPCIALIALGCAQIDRSLGDSMGSGGSSTLGGSSSVGGSSSSTGGSSAVGGGSSVGGETTGCAFVPEAPRDRPAPTTHGLAYDRIHWFIADAAPAEPALELPGTPTVEWASEAALSLLDSFGTEPAPGITRFFATWMPELGTPDVGALAFSGRLMASDPEGSMRGLFTYPANPTHPGILADPAFLQAKPGISARGTWMLEHLFCIQVPRPPPDLEEVIPPYSGLTRRQALEAAVSPAPCTACHKLLDPLAYSLENYDELGAFRTVDENGLPIDSSGTYFSQTGEEFVFAGLTDVANQLGTSCEVARCLARSLLTDAMYENGLLGPDQLPEEAEVNRIANAVTASSFSLREMVRAVAESLTFQP